MRRFLAAALLALLLAPVARAQAPSAAEQELIKLETTWAVMWQKKDAAGLDKLFATEYISTNNDGATATKKQDIDLLKDVTGFTYKLENMKAHAYDDKFGFVTGSNTVTQKIKGKDVSGTYVFTDVFVKRDGRWQVVATQSSLLKK